MRVIFIHNDHPPTSLFNLLIYASLLFFFTSWSQRSASHQHTKPTHVSFFSKILGFLELVLLKKNPLKKQVLPKQVTLQRREHLVHLANLNLSRYRVHASILAIFLLMQQRAIFLNFLVVLVRFKMSS